MGWSTLTSEADYIRDGNEDLLNTTDYPDSTLINLYLDSAKKDLEVDLAFDLGFDQNETDYYDDLLELTRNETILKKALAYIQLRYIYQTNMVMDGVNELRFNYYDRKYNDYRKRFFSQMFVRGNNPKTDTRRWKI